MAALLCLGTAAGVGYQLVNGAPRIDLHFYAAVLLVWLLLPTMMVAVLAMLVHVVVSNRFVGHLVTIGLIAGFATIEYLGVESRLIRFADIPEVPLSDMNGVGHFLTAPLWFLAYWGCISVLLGVATVDLWVRGPASPLLARVRVAVRDDALLAGRRPPRPLGDRADGWVYLL